LNVSQSSLQVYQGQWGILETLHPDTEKDAARDRLFASHGISIIHYCEAQRCNEDADRIVQEFLDTLSQG